MSPYENPVGRLLNRTFRYRTGAAMKIKLLS